MNIKKFYGKNSHLSKNTSFEILFKIFLLIIIAFSDFTNTAIQVNPSNKIRDNYIPQIKKDLSSKNGFFVIWVEDNPNYNNILPKQKIVGKYYKYNTSTKLIEESVTVEIENKDLYDNISTNNNNRVINKLMVDSTPDLDRGIIAWESRSSDSTKSNVFCRIIKTSNFEILTAPADEIVDNTTSLQYLLDLKYYQTSGDITMYLVLYQIKDTSSGLSNISLKIYYYPQLNGKKISDEFKLFQAKANYTAAKICSNFSSSQQVLLVIRKLDSGEKQIIKKLFSISNNNLITFYNDIIYFTSASLDENYINCELVHDRYNFYFTSTDSTTKKASFRILENDFRYPLDLNPSSDSSFESTGNIENPRILYLGPSYTYRILMWEEKRNNIDSKDIFFSFNDIPINQNSSKRANSIIAGDQNQTQIFSMVSLDSNRSMDLLFGIVYTSADLINQNLKSIYIDIYFSINLRVRQCTADNIIGDFQTDCRNKFQLNCNSYTYSPEPDCIQQASGFYLSKASASSAAMVSNPCSDNCSECETSQSCNICTNGFFKLNSNTCVPDNLKNCITFQSGVCKDCEAKYFPDPTTKLCLKCIDNCLTCLNNSSCEICDSKYYFDSAQKMCTICPKNCLKCDNNGACTSCESNYTPKNGLCVFSTVLPNCALMNGEVCKICNTRYFLNGGVCDKCIDNCKTCSDGKTCDYCIEGYNPIKSNDNKGGFYINSCILPISPINPNPSPPISPADPTIGANYSPVGCNSFDAQNKICKSCYEGFYLSSGACLQCNLLDVNCSKCSANKCTECKIGFKLNSSGLCDCFDNCPKCDLNCKTCVLGKCLDIKCADFCSSCNVEGKCDPYSCYPGYKLTTDYRCEFMSNCNKNSSDGKCIECINGYIQSEKTGDCICPNEIYDSVTKSYCCGDVKHCLKDQVKYFQNLKKCGCFLCDSNQFHYKYVCYDAVVPKDNNCFIWNEEDEKFSGLGNKCLFNDIGSQYFNLVHNQFCLQNDKITFNAKTLPSNKQDIMIFSLDMNRLYTYLGIRKATEAVDILKCSDKIHSYFFVQFNCTKTIDDQLLSFLDTPNFIIKESQINYFNDRAKANLYNELVEYYVNNCQKDISFKSSVSLKNFCIDGQNTKVDLLKSTCSSKTACSEMTDEYPLVGDIKEMSKCFSCGGNKYEFQYDFVNRSCFSSVIPNADLRLKLKYIFLGFAGVIVLGIIALYFLIFMKFKNDEKKKENVKEWLVPFFGGLDVLLDLSFLLGNTYPNPGIKYTYIGIYAIQPFILIIYGGFLYITGKPNNCYKNVIIRVTFFLPFCFLFAFFGFFSLFGNNYDPLEINKFLVYVVNLDMTKVRNKKKIKLIIKTLDFFFEGIPEMIMKAIVIYFSKNKDTLNIVNVIFSGFSLIFSIFFLWREWNEFYFNPQVDENDDTNKENKIEDNKDKKTGKELQDSKASEVGKDNHSNKPNEGCHDINSKDMIDEKQITHNNSKNKIVINDEYINEERKSINNIENQMKIESESGRGNNLHVQDNQGTDQGLNGNQDKFINQFSRPVFRSVNISNSKMIKDFKFDIQERNNNNTINNMLSNENKLNKVHNYNNYNEEFEKEKIKENKPWCQKINKRNQSEGISVSAINNNLINPENSLRKSENIDINYNSNDSLDEGDRNKHNEMDFINKNRLDPNLILNDHGKRDDNQIIQYNSNSNQALNSEDVILKIEGSNFVEESKNNYMNDKIKPKKES